MRGDDEQTSHMFSYVSPEQRVPADHPLRAIRALTDEALRSLSRRFAGLYSQTGRPSIPPAQLLRALLLQVLYTVRSERLLMEELDYNLLFRWFVGLNLDDPVWHPTTFTKNRDRLLAGDVAAAFFDAVAAQARQAGLLADLKMPGALEAVDGVLAKVDSGAVTAGEAIELVLNAQIALRNNRRLQAAMRSSRLPAVKTLAQFDFTFQPSIKREQIESLHELGFLDRRENVILLGPPGVGKTHLAISLAIAAAEADRRVYYGTLAGLIDSLTDARAAGALSRRLRVLTHPALLVVDEIGYLPVSQDGAVLFF